VLRDLQPESDPHASSSAVQLYGVLLKRAAVPLAGLLWQGVQPLVALVMHSEESGLLENACDVMVCLVQRSPAQIIDAGLVVPMLQCVERLLGPGLDDGACFFVGPFLTLLLEKFGSSFPPHVVAGLLHALVTRLARAKLPYLQQELLVVVARLLHQDMPGVVTALANAQVSVNEGAGSRNGMELLLSLWLANAEQVRARRARNVTITALCRLHDRCADDESLRSLRVDGVSAPPLAERLLSAIVAALEFENERCRRSTEHLKKAADIPSDDDGDDDGGDDLDDDDKRQQRLLEDYIDLEDDSDEDEAVAELLTSAGGAGGDSYFDLERSDPFHSLDLRRSAVEFLAQLKQRPADEALVARITAAVREASAAGPGK